MSGSVQKPFPNEHAARQAEPSKFKEFNRVDGSEHGFPAGVDIIFGITAEGKSEIQSLRFDREMWTVSRAKEWLNMRDEFTSAGFEPATDKRDTNTNPVRELEFPPRSKPIELDKDLEDSDHLVLAALGFNFMDPDKVPHVKLKVLKADQELMEVTGVVLAADEVDAQGDIITAEEIRKAMRVYLLENGMTVGFRHKQELKQADVVELWQSPVAFEMNGEKIGVGDWVMTTNFSKVPDVWADIKAGKLNAYSIGGFGERTPVDS